MHFGQICFTFVRIRNDNAIQVHNDVLYILGLYLRNVNFNFVTQLRGFNNTVDNSLVVKNLTCGNRSCAVIFYSVKEGTYFQIEYTRALFVNNRHFGFNLRPCAPATS